MSEKEETMLLRMAEIAMKNSEMTMQRLLQLVQLQTKIIEGASNDIGEEFRSLMIADDATASFQAWPAVLENTSRTATEGATALLQNLMQYQSEILRMMQDRMLELNTQFGDIPISRRPAEATTDIPLDGRRATRKQGAAHAARARKAA